MMMDSDRIKLEPQLIDLKHEDENELDELQRKEENDSKREVHEKHDEKGEHHQKDAMKEEMEELKKKKMEHEDEDEVEVDEVEEKMKLDFQSQWVKDAVEYGYLESCHRIEIDLHLAFHEASKQLR